jgi:hypothetical protein
MSGGIKMETPFDHLEELEGEEEEGANESGPQPEVDGSEVDSAVADCGSALPFVKSDLGLDDVSRHVRHLGTG